MKPRIIHFKTHALLKNLVGKDLINEDEIAILELVKNGYDAGSPKVLVRFTDFDPERQITTATSQIIIADEGVGMNADDIENKWLNIAYSEKTMHSMQPGAYLAGNKGIGRFSCDRLGKHLDLLSRKDNDELLLLQVDWPDFEVMNDPGKMIQDINLTLVSITDTEAQQITGLETFPKTGTVLVISKLRSIWTYLKLKKLKIALEKFIDPNQMFLRKQFKVTISIPSIDEIEANKEYKYRITGEIHNQIFNNLKFKATYIDATIHPDGKTITIALYHNGEKVFYVTEKNHEYPLLKNIHVVVYYLNPYRKSYFKRQTGVRAVDFGSIFLFLNGFRVMPYGERGNDWLGLDVRKTQGVRRHLGSRDVVGRIEIVHDGHDFVPVSSREGLKNTDAFKQLRENFFKDLIKKMETFVVDGLKWDRVPEEIRKTISSEQGLDWAETTEIYSEIWDAKRQRIALLIMSLINLSPERTIKFWVNPTLLENVYQNKQKDLKKLLKKLDKVGNQTVLSNDLSKSVTQIKRLVEQTVQESQEAKEEAAQLKAEVIEQKQHIQSLTRQTETYRAQALFLQNITSLSVKDLIQYHHQIGLDATVVENYLRKTLNILRKLPDIDEQRKALSQLEKAIFVVRRIKTVAHFATKANFRFNTQDELTDIPIYIEQYLLNVSKDFMAANLEMKIENKVQEPFEINISRMELSILIDNLIDNAIKAHARTIHVQMHKKDDTSLVITFADDGKGLSPDIPDVDALFDLGVTTTNGSGLGLYHARAIVKKMGGKISAIPTRPAGMQFRIEVSK